MLEEELTTTKVAIRNKKPGVLVPNAILNILSIGIDRTLHTQQIKEALLEVQEENKSYTYIIELKGFFIVKGTTTCLHT